MSNKKLIVYGTLSGSTIKVAEAIRDELSQDGTSVDCHPLTEVTNIDRYGTVKQETPANGLSSALAKVPQVKPVSVGFFGGKLDYSQLSLLPKLFVKIIIRGEEGDYRN